MLIVLTLTAVPISFRLGGTQIEKLAGTATQARGCPRHTRRVIRALPAAVGRVAFGCSLSKIKGDPTTAPVLGSAIQAHEAIAPNLPDQTPNAWQRARLDPMPVPPVIHARNLQSAAKRTKSTTS